jgi:hypothetical protein
VEKVVGVGAEAEASRKIEEVVDGTTVLDLVEPVDVKRVFGPQNMSVVNKIL